jgi:hypothetical protein
MKSCLFDWCEAMQPIMTMLKMWCSTSKGTLPYSFLRYGTVYGLT